jgi:hypothetical protein
MAIARTDAEVLAAGGCDWRGDVHENGATWNPRVLPYGEMNCVDCKCKVRKRRRIYFFYSATFHTDLAEVVVDG